MLAAAVAMTVTRLQKGRVDFKTYAATQAAATDRFFHAKLYDKTRIARICDCRSRSQLCI